MNGKHYSFPHLFSLKQILEDNTNFFTCTENRQEEKL